MSCIFNATAVEEITVTLSTSTLVIKKEILFKECVPGITDDDCPLWNFNHCPNDDDYSNPFIKGDKIYFQYIMDSLKNDIGTVVLVDNGSSEEYSEFVTIQKGYDADGKYYVNIIVDTQNIPPGITCWYLKIELVSYSQNTLNSCIINAISEEEMTLEEAQESCREEVGVVGILYTEPFFSSPCVGTVLIQGVHSKYDCDGNYYAAFADGSANDYSASVRVRGEVIQEGFEFIEKLQNNKRQSVQKRRQYKLNTIKLPPYVVEIIAKCFESKTLTIDEVEYLGGVKLQKQFEEGQMWIINTELNRLCDENNFNCS